MPWIDAITDVEALRRSIRDLVAISTLPAIWKDYDPHQIADGIAAALRSLLDLELVHISIRAAAKEPPIEVTHIANSSSSASIAEAREILLSGYAARLSSSESLVQPTIGDLRIEAIPIGLGGEATLIAASREKTFPNDLQRFLLTVGANEAAIALHRWRSDTNQKRFASLADSSSDFVGYASLDGRPQYINPAGCELVGLSGFEEARKHHILEYLMPEERRRARTEIAPIVAEKGRWRGEVEFRHFRTGAAIPFFVDWFRIDDPRTGLPLNMATVSRDLSAAKAAEANLLRLNESLELRVLERTAALADANRQLVKEISERERADARLQELQFELFHAARHTAAGQMAAALAHELNQPLTAAANYVNSARRLLTARAGSALGEAIDVLEEASTQIVRSGEIIRNLREFISRGTTQRKAESITRLVEDASALTLSVNKTPGVTVTFKLDAGDVMAFADRIQIQLVLNNLIRNALEALAESGRRELLISTTRCDEATVEISVADTGPGVAPEIYDRVFEPFVSTKREGMGIGLPISRSIIDAHGGELTVESPSGGGTTFRFTLPVVSGKGAAHGG